MPGMLEVLIMVGGCEVLHFLGSKLCPSFGKTHGIGGDGWRLGDPTFPWSLL